MKKIAKIALSIFLLAGVFIFPAFSKSWYLCLGSYKQKNNAISLMKSLAEEGVETVLDTIPRDSEVLYRVFLADAYESSEIARKKLADAENLSAIKKLKISGIWVCSGSDFVTKITTAEAAVNSNKVTKIEITPVTTTISETEKEPADTNTIEAVAEEVSVKSVTNEEKPLVFKANALTGNKKSGLSKKRPYTVLVRSYKDENQALYSRQRLVKNQISAFVLRKYNDNDYFSFDLCSGTFKTLEEAELLQNELAAAGIKNTQIQNYNDLEQQLLDYDNVVGENSVLYETADIKFGDYFTDKIVRALNLLPLNFDYSIEKLMIFDMENIVKSEAIEVDIDSFEIRNYYNDNEKVKSAVYAVYKDSVYEKEIRICVEIAAAETFDTDSIVLNNELDMTSEVFATARGTINCIRSAGDDSFILSGVSEDGSVLLSIYADDYTEEEFNSFLKNIKVGVSVLSYAGFRKNLLVLPKLSSNNGDFLYYTLDSVPSSFVFFNNFARWSYGLVGQWSAEAYYEKDNVVSCEKIYNLNYDYAAEQLFDKLNEEDVQLLKSYVMETQTLKEDAEESEEFEEDSGDNETIEEDELDAAAIAVRDAK